MADDFSMESVEYPIEKYAVILRLKAERDLVRSQQGKGESHYRDVLRRWMARELERHYPSSVTSGEAFAKEMTDWATGQRAVRAYVRAVRDVASEHRPAVESLLADPAIRTPIRIPVVRPIRPS